MIRTVSMAEGEPGLRPLSAALEDEGFDDVGAGAAGRELRAPSHGADRRLAGATASPRSRSDYLARLDAARKACSRGIDDNGDLLVRRVGKADVERRKLARRAARRRRWLDPQTGGPRA